MQQLEEQTNFTNSILKNSSGGITVTEVIRNEHGGVIDGKIILANEAAEKLLHITKSDYENKSIAEVEPSILTNPIYQMALETLHNGVPFRTQYFFEPIGKWIELSVSKMDENHLINLLTDITETKEAQFQFQQAAERHQAVFKASQSGMFTFAPEFNEGGEVIDFRFVITNPSFAAYVGQTPEVLQGALGSTWFPGYLTNGVFDMYKQTYLTGVTLRKDIHYFVDQHDLYLDLLSTKIGNEVLVTFTDYTKLKKAQLQLEKLVEDLKRSNANLEEFAHAASHDMKEPIRKVLTFSDRLKSSLEPRMTEAEKNLFSRMENATQRMGILVDDLLAFSHLSERPKEMEVVDLNKKLENVLGDLELLIDEKGATIDIGSLPVVKGHRRQLQQLFQNLIGNALKYSKPNIDPVITITCEEVLGKDSPIHKLVESDDRSFYWIQVRDNGIGFEQQYAERIFAMFQRLHGKSEYAGTGVGLSIARKVVENHNGYIWAQSEPGAGATFHVLLPV
jgi:signal transduction histidine kinase